MNNLLLLSTATTLTPLHKRRNVPKYACKHCEKRFKLGMNLKRHLQLHTSTDRRYVCHLCGNRFTYERFLQKHLERHAKKQKNSTSCEFENETPQMQQKKHIEGHSQKPDYHSTARELWNEKPQMQLQEHLRPHAKKQENCSSPSEFGNEEPQIQLEENLAYQQNHSTCELGTKESRRLQKVSPSLYTLKEKLCKFIFRIFFF